MGAIVLFVVLGLAAWALVRIDRLKRPAAMKCSICGKPMTIAIISEAGHPICVKCDCAIRKALKSAEDARK
jgi:hypothetical protein